MDKEKESKGTEQELTLEGGTYEIIRNRLLAQGKELQDRLEKLNQSRKDIFGAIEHALLATDRITTQNNCTPQDMVPIDANRFIFGYTVHIGLKSETQLSDVFSIYEYRDQSFHEQPLDILQKHEKFVEDYRNLYKYYRESRFIKFFVKPPHMLMVFRTGKTETDIKTCKWILEDGNLTYVDNRSDHEYKFPPQHDFRWIRTSRDWHRMGKFPHISIEDRLFVESVGGDITFKIEDNTDSGQGIYAEEVENLDQTLDDAEIFYSTLGNMILVKIRPYLEEKFRYFIFNEKTQNVARLDEIEDACVLLPDDHGLIFSNGYYLQSGELKRFESGLSGMKFENRIASPNGEDFLYVFYNPTVSKYILLSYNLIGQKVEIPIFCNGFTCFENGEMLIFRSEEEPTKHHVIQIWQTPYVGVNYVFSEKSDSYLYKIGNPAIVRCMAECSELLKMIHKDDPYPGLYNDMVKKTTDVMDSYFWLDREEAFSLKDVIQKIKDAASGAVDEFEKVVRLKKNAKSEVARVSEKVRSLLHELDSQPLDNIGIFVENLSNLRSVRGEIITLKDLRYVNLPEIEALEAEVATTTEALSGRCVEFLLKPEALDPYIKRVSEMETSIEKLSRGIDAKERETEAGKASDELEMLIEIVSNLKIEDATQTTRIIESISAIYSRLNAVKANIKTKKKNLQSVESTAQFNAQIKLLNQSVVNYLDITDTPQKCEDYLTRVMVAIEELEGRFTDFDEFIVQLSEKRNEIYTAFESKKVNLIESRNRRANVLFGSAERILKGIRNRVSGMDSIEAINGYFASDLMIEKIRDIARQLVELEDSVKADDIQSRLKTIREDTVRQLKDRQDLFVDGANVINLGAHKFSVNVQPLDLTIVLRDGKQMLYLAGTNFFEPITDAEFLATQPVWDMEVASQNDKIYRAEYLAFQMLRDILSKDNGTPERFKQDEDWLIAVQQFMGPRYSEGYTKGVHDHDAAKILKPLVHLHDSLGMLRYPPQVRVLARLFWTLLEDAIKSPMDTKLSSFGTINTIFPGQKTQQRYLNELETMILSFAEKNRMFSTDHSKSAAAYLFEELCAGGAFVVSKEAWELNTGFDRHIKATRFIERFKNAREKLAFHREGEFELVRDWMKGYLSSLNQPELENYVDEAAFLCFTGAVIPENVLDVSVSTEIDGLIGDHSVVQNGIYHLNYHRFIETLTHHETHVVPMFTRYHDLKKRLIEQHREEMRLDEFRPRVLTSFVRNKLINDVYLPLIGDNLAKQIGVVGEGKRTDLMGMLLLISPPGYGKTTLMEYIANRLGVIFMKINGPAIGHQVTSLDPGEAQNASAREEIMKLSLSFEMGDNVMIYLDDIQHCNPELLQKFISLCDAQRKIEGVYKGKSRTYDFRGKKVAVVMAGNPYTESGEKFKIPDMLANRADTYNLGDIIGDKTDAFIMSYLENAITSNPVLSRLSSKSQQDVYSIIRIAETGTREGVDFSSTYSPEEIEEMVSVMKKMIVIRDVILKVNQQYIYSAGQADDYRTEPAFKLQGSYRNMNRMAGKIVPVMNQEELKTLILSHYEMESQTLTTGAEANLLKFKELVGWLTESERARWEDIKKTFMKNRLLRGTDGSDPINRVIAQLSAFQDGLESIKDVLAAGMTQIEKRCEIEVKTDSTTPEMTQISLSDETLSAMSKLIGDLKTALPGVQAVQETPSPANAPMLPTTVRTIYKMPKNYYYIAIKAGDVEGLRILLEKGQDSNVKTTEGATPLMATAVHRQPDLAQMLIDYGADIDAQDKDGYTALMIAASRGYEDVVQILIDNQANLHIKDKDGMTAWMWAEKKGHVHLMDRLIAY